MMQKNLSLLTRLSKHLFDKLSTAVIVSILIAWYTAYSQNITNVITQTISEPWVIEKNWYQEVNDTLMLLSGSIWGGIWDGIHLSEYVSNGTWVVPSWVTSVKVTLGGGGGGWGWNLWTGGAGWTSSFWAYATAAGWAGWAVASCLNGANGATVTLSTGNWGQPRWTGWTWGSAWGAWSTTIRYITWLIPWSSIAITIWAGWARWPGPCTPWIWGGWVVAIEY